MPDVRKNIENLRNRKKSEGGPLIRAREARKSSERAFKRVRAGERRRAFVFPSSPARTAPSADEASFVSRLRAAIGERYDHEGLLMFTLGVGQIPANAVAEYLRRRVEFRGLSRLAVDKNYGGAASRRIGMPLQDAVIEGIRKSTSFTQVKGIPFVVGLGADILVDPSWLVPETKVFDGIKFMAKAGFGGAKRVPVMGKAMDEFLTAFNDGARFRKLGLEGLENLRLTYYGERNLAISEIKDTATKEIEKLNLSEEEMREVYILLHDEPASLTAHADDFYETVWKPRFDELNERQREAFRIMDRSLKKLEEVRVGSELIQESVALSRVEGYMRYVPYRLRRTIDDAVETLGALRARALRDIGSTDSRIEKLVGKMNAAKRASAEPGEIRRIEKEISLLRAKQEKAREVLSNVENALDDLHEMPRVVSNEELEAAYDMALARIREGIDIKFKSPAGDKTVDIRESFQFKRKGRGRITDIEREVRTSAEHNVLGAGGSAEDARKAADEAAKQLFQELETDLSRLLHVESVATANALARNRYLSAFLDWAKNNDLVHVIDETAESALSVPDGYVSLNIKGLEHVYVPKEAADEMRSVMFGYVSRRAFDTNANKAYRIFRAITSTWKAWTLAPIAPYHVRNIVSNTYMAVMAGNANPKSYSTAFELLSRWENGIFDGIEVAGMSGKELYKEALRNLVIDSGVVAETRSLVEDVSLATLGSNRGLTGKFLRAIDPNRSAIIRKGFDIGERIENTYRLGMFIDELGKNGGDVAAAAAKVRKFFFDYRYGLSGNEAKIFRDLLIPFYTFTRFNIPLEFELLSTRWRAMVATGKFVDAAGILFGGPKEPEDLVPEFIRRGVPIPVKYDPETNSKPYFLFGAWWPASQIDLAVPSELAHEALSMINPILSTLPQVAIGVSAFRREKIERFPGEETKVLGVLPLRKKLAEFVYLFRPLNEANAIVRTMAANYGGTEWYQRVARGIGRLIAGRVYPVDFDKQINRYENETRSLFVEMNGMYRHLVLAGDDRNANKVLKILSEINARRERVLGPGNRLRVPSKDAIDDYRKKMKSIRRRPYDRGGRP